MAPGKPTSCTATVSDSASSAKPTGTVSFASNGTTFFSGLSSSCTLAPSGGNSASCTIGAVPLGAGAVPIGATYGGDPVHSPSGAGTSLCAGTASECGHPPPPAVKCTVPKLKGKTLAQARKLLIAAHCRLGKVSKPKRHGGHRASRLIVRSQHPAAGTRLAAGARVAVRMVPASKHH